MEHHSNLLPWQHAAKRAGAQLKFVECSKDGKITLEDVAAVLTEKTRIMAITQMSNVLGCVNDIKGIASLCHEKGHRTGSGWRAECAAYAGQCGGAGCGFLSFSGHKMLAPMGIGALYGKMEWLEKCLLS